MGTVNKESTTNYQEQGAEKWVVNGTLEVNGTIEVNGTLNTSNTLGTAGTGVTAVETGVDGSYKTVLTIDAFTQAVAGAALGFGKELYTFPEGMIKVKYATIDLTIAAATETGTPDVGIGTVVASGVIDVLSGTATFEDIMDGFTATAITSGGSVSNNYVAAEAGVLDGHTTAKKAFLNIAETWTATENLTISGTVSVYWDYLGDY